MIGPGQGDLAPGGFQQLRQAVAAHARDRYEWQLARAHVPRQTLEASRIIERIDLVGGHDLRLRCHVRIEQSQLLLDGVEVLDRIAPGRSGHIDQVDEYLGALHVPEEAIAKAVTLVSALDQAGDIGNHEAAIITETDDAQVRRERGEGVISNLGARRRDSRDQRRLSRVGKADEANVGEQLQFKAKELLFPGFPGLCAPGSAIGGADEARVPASATPATDDELWPRVLQVAAQSMGDRQRTEHLVFESFDGVTLRLSIDDSGADIARYLRTQTDKIADLVKRATGRSVKIDLDVSNVKRSPAPAVTTDAPLPEIVRKAVDLFDATVVSIDPTS